jgi:hypothetical protein
VNKIEKSLGVKRVNLICKEWKNMLYLVGVGVCWDLELAAIDCAPCKSSCSGSRSITI